MWLPVEGRAQRAPLSTEDPRPIESGAVLAEAGAEALAGRDFPLSGLSGDLFTLPALRFRFGFGRAEFSLSGGFDVLAIESRDQAAPFADRVEVDGDVTTDIHDPVVSTKILLQHETRRRPAIGVRLATRFPSAANKSGLGNDATDVFLALLAGKSLGRTRVAANLGLGVLSIPERGDRQNDVLVYGASVSRPVSRTVVLVAEAVGRVDVKGDTPAGTENLGQARVGARWDAWQRDRHRLGIHAAAVAGLAEAEADYGVVAGVSLLWTDAFVDR